MAEYIERETVMKIIDDYGCTHGDTLGSHSGAVAPVKHGHIVWKEYHKGGIRRRKCLQEIRVCSH